MNHKIDCIERLLKLNHSYDEICDWLVLNKFTDDISVKANLRLREKAEFIYKVLKQKEKEEKIILLYFEWSTLPSESIKITCTTQEEEKVFTYGL